MCGISYLGSNLLRSAYVYLMLPSSLPNLRVNQVNRLLTTSKGSLKVYTICQALLFLLLKAVGCSDLEERQFETE